MAKSWSELSPAYRQRLESWATRHGYTVQQIRANPSLQKQARGHKFSEGHRRFKVTERAPNPQARLPSNRPREWMVGNSYLQSGENSFAPAHERYDGAAVPTPSDILKAAQNTTTPTIFIRVQVIGAGEGSDPADTIKWHTAIADREETLRLIEQAVAGEPRSDDENREVMAELASTLLEGEPIIAALVWGFSDR